MTYLKEKSGNVAMLWDRKLACGVWVTSSLYSQPFRIRRIGEQRTVSFGPLQSAGRHHHNQHSPLDCEMLVCRIVKILKKHVPSNQSRDRMFLLKFRHILFPKEPVSAYVFQVITAVKCSRSRWTLPQSQNHSKI